MVETGADANIIFRKVEKINISDMHHKAHGYFELLSIGNVGNDVLPNNLLVSSLKNLSGYVQQAKISMTECSQILYPSKLRVQLQRNLLINLGFIGGNMNGLTLGLS